MSEDRLEGAVEEMRRETVDATTLDAARARVWDKVTNAAVSGCTEFQPEFPAYLSGTLIGGRRMLLEDHISRCSACRAELADLRGDRKVVAMPRRSSTPWRRWGSLAAAAALALSVLYLGRDTLDAWMAPGGPRATVVSAGGGLYAMPGGALDAGAAIGEKEMVRTGPGAHAVLRLADGSTVDVNERTEMYVTAAWSGQAIHLQRGDVIVQAAKQRRGHLRVLTRDSIASVKGTVFAVSAGMGGSVVSVVEGSVQVNQPGRELMLSPGQQAASNPALASSVAQAVSWSPDADEYLQLLASFEKIGQQVAQFSGPLRTTSNAAAVSAGRRVRLRRRAESRWQHRPGPGRRRAAGARERRRSGRGGHPTPGCELRRIVDRVKSVSAMLGDEVAFSIANRRARATSVPMVMARVQPGQRAALTSSARRAVRRGRRVVAAVLGLRRSDAGLGLPVAPGVGHQPSGPGRRLCVRGCHRRSVQARRRLAGCAIDAAPVIQMAADDDAPPVKLAGMAGVKYLFLEQRSPAGAEENEVTLMFGGRAAGMASWLADSGSGGAAEYLPADALVAGYARCGSPGSCSRSSPR